MYCVRVALLTALAAICSGSSGDFPLVLAEESDTTTYTKTETAMMEAFNFCTNDEPITWIDKSANSVAGNVKAGAANSDTKPTYGADGKIVDLASFVEERLKILPNHNDDSINMNPSNPLLNVATLIIENDCAYVEQPSDDCVFDYYGTPAPLQWGPEDVRSDDPDNYANWNSNSMTVVYIPPSNNGDSATATATATELTDKKNLAELKTRGNSSKGNPKKQFGLTFTTPQTLLPGTAAVEKWVVSSKQGSSPLLIDYTYVGNPIAFSTYRRFGELQKEYSDNWPLEGSVEDMATRAWAPYSQPVQLIFQGRYVGLFNILEKVNVVDVDVDADSSGSGHVWMPQLQEQYNVTVTERKNVSGLPIPTGNYFLTMDWANGNYNHTLSLPSNPEWVNVEHGAFLTSDAGLPQNETLFASPSNVWYIDYPKNVHFDHFDQSNEENDVHLLRQFLNQIQIWSKDPITNDKKLAQVLDMKSIARYFLLEEMTRELDSYGASASFKFINGKLYHAAPWDYGSTIFAGSWCATRTINYTTNTIESVLCDKTLFQTTLGWKVDELYDLISCNSRSVFGLKNGCENVEPGTPFDEAKVYDSRYLFRMLFRAPSLQKEFWDLWDLVVQHHLLDTDASTSPTASVTSNNNNEDLFGAGKMMDEMYQYVADFAQADLDMHHNMVQVITLFSMFSDLLNSTKIKDTCGQDLEETLLGTVSKNYTDTDPSSIPARKWSFDQADRIAFEFMNGKFMDLVRNQSNDILWYGIVPLHTYVLPRVQSADAVSMDKKWIKERLEWIETQKPGGDAGGGNDEGTSEVVLDFGDDNGSCKTIRELLCESPAADSYTTVCKLWTNSDSVKSNEGVSMTVFVPTDDAFATLNDLSEQAKVVLNSTAFEKILMFHATPGMVLSTDLECTGTLEMFGSGASRTKCGKANQVDYFIQKGSGNRKNDMEPIIIAADIMACNNSVIQIVSEVMLPNFIEDLN